jgi:hypothetical protein
MSLLSNTTIPVRLSHTLLDPLNAIICDKEKSEVHYSDYLMRNQLLCCLRICLSCIQFLAVWSVYVKYNIVACSDLFSYQQLGTQILKVLPWKCNSRFFPVLVHCICCCHQYKLLIVVLYAVLFSSFFEAIHFLYDVFFASVIGFIWSSHIFKYFLLFYLFIFPKHILGSSCKLLNICDIILTKLGFC